jgi:hypothetical protein
MNIAAIVLGSLGFALSLCIVMFEILHRHRKLVIYAPALDIYSVRDNGSIVVFHLCFLNPSTEYKTASHIGLNMPRELTVLEFEKRHEAGQSETICKLPNTDFEDLLLSSDELIQTPLDIPPLQSLKKAVSPLH